MTPDQRFALIISGIGILAGLIGWVIRTLWKASGLLSSARDTIERNNKAVGTLTDSVNVLNNEMAYFKGQQQRRDRR